MINKKRGRKKIRKQKTKKVGKDTERWMKKKIKQSRKGLRGAATARVKCTGDVTGYR
jgi:hypothetical protein